MGEELQGTGPPDDSDLLPFDKGEDGREENARRAPVPASLFRYLGEPKTAEEFTSYVASYDFGDIPPDYVVLHHTAVPGLGRATIPGKKRWDDDEDELSDDQIKARRRAKLDRIKELYRTGPDYLWDRGPHLFIDDRYIWLFTPMADEGIHARWGNGFERDGELHYSIGIEVIGYYEHIRWAPEVERLVGHAVAVLKQKLNTFELRYMYPDGNPGRIGTGPELRVRFPDRLAWRGIASHRDYSKPECPGAAITEDYYIGVIEAGWQRLVEAAPAPGTYTVTAVTLRIRKGPGRSFPVANNGTALASQSAVLEIDDVVGGELVGDSPWWGRLANDAGFVSMKYLAPRRETAVTLDSPLLGVPACSLEQCQRFVLRKSHGSYGDDDVRSIVRLYWQMAEAVGIDPVLAVAQMVLETDYLSSTWSQPPHRNPAGIGVTGEPGAGISFPNWLAAVRAHLGRLLAYAVPEGSATPVQQSLIDEALEWRALPRHLRGSAPTLRDLAGTWAADQQYAEKLVERAGGMLAMV